MKLHVLSASVPNTTAANNLTAVCQLPTAPVYANTGITVAGGTDFDQLSAPTDILLDQRSNNLYIVDADNKRVLKYLLNSEERMIVAGQGYPELKFPQTLSTDNDENLFIVDNYHPDDEDIASNYSVIYWPCNSTDGIVLLNGTGSCYGIYLDNDYNILASAYNLHRVIKWLAPYYNSSVVVAGTGTAGSNSDQLNAPKAIYVDSTNNELYIIDSGNDRLQKWSLNSNSTTFEGGTVAVRGTSPAAVAVDCNGAIYVTDKSEYSIKLYSSIAITGLEGVVLVDTSKSSGHKYYPTSIVLNPKNGDLYVLDKDQDQVKKYVIDGQLNIRNICKRCRCFQVGEITGLS
ncbi:unnamed protein product [Didymodactylos carnosus]|uniref:NHL repeat-containing protein n=1 Tax=Didymodactylos carnosus TaxID=1234261 RepID=A0A8S2EAZ9_9BILA|nr:unnamed protein product [Didymodactylos carnosus]CAF3876865.1 unnamed protein product [Didymodactylos carnosus]